MKLNFLLLTLLLLVVVGCQNKAKESDENLKVEDTISAPKVAEDNQAESDAGAAENYAQETTNEETANKIKAFLVEKLKADLSGMTEQDRTFSFYEIDLNDDSKNEYFISLLGRYFCGSGGCSFYLLNNDMSVNTYFSVTDTPIFRSSQVTNGWHDLILFGDRDENGGVKNYIHLKFDKSKGKYPSNPSVIKKIEMAPSGEDFIMWDENFSPAKTFTF